MESNDTKPKLLVGFYYVTTVGLMLGVAYTFLPKMRHFFTRLFATIYKMKVSHTAVTYKEHPLTPVSKRRLQLVQRKTLILDMDETLITARCQRRRNIPKLPDTPYDYFFTLTDYSARFYVYKRPYVDLFLDHVSKWYDVVVFTAGVEPYATPVLDFLDKGRHILDRRKFRHHCTDVQGIRGKFVSTVNTDLANVLLVDNSDMECSFNVGNALHVESYRIGSKDQALLHLLPFLDALRFTYDVRSMLRRSTRYECLRTALNSVRRRRSFQYFDHEFLSIFEDS